MSQLILENSRVLRGELDLHIRTLEMIANRPEVKAMNYQRLLAPLLNDIRNTDFIDIGLVEINGNVSYARGSTEELGNEAYIQEALNGEPAISNVIYNQYSVTSDLLFAVPIYDGPSVIEGLVGKIPASILSDITDSLGQGLGGYAFMVADDGTFIAHPDRDNVIYQYNPLDIQEGEESSQGLVELVEDMITKDNGLPISNIDGEEFIVGFRTVDGTGWTVALVVASDLILSSLNTLEADMVKIIGVILILSVVFVAIIGTRITKPIIEVAKNSERIAGLDITEDMPERLTRRKDELGNLSKGIQVIINNLRQIIKELQNTSEHLGSSSQELSATLQETAIAADGVTKTVEEIAKGASDQAQSTEEGTIKAQALGVSIEENQVYLNNLESAAKNVTEAVKDGIEEIENIEVISQESRSAASEVYKVVMETRWCWSLAFCIVN